MLLYHKPTRVILRLAKPGHGAQNHAGDNAVLYVSNAIKQSPRMNPGKIQKGIPNLQKSKHINTGAPTCLVPQGAQEAPQGNKTYSSRNLKKQV